VDERATITVLVPRVAVTTLLVLVAGTLVTNNNATGSFNKLMFAGILALAVAMTAFFLYAQRSTRVDAALAIIASAGLLWGMWTIERPQLLTSYWEGFGYRVALVALVLALLFVTVLHPSVFSWPVRVALGLILAACCAADLLGLIRTFDYMPYVNNNINEINDALGPVAGKIPDSTFIPQYTTLYGWLFLPLKHVLSPSTLVAVISLFFTLLGALTVLLAVWIVKRVLSINGFLLAAALVIPLTYVTSHLAGDQSSIASLFQEIPVRLLSGFVILAVGLNDLILLYRGTIRPRQLALIGLLCAIVAWNSQDFGLAAAGVYGVLVLFGTAPAARVRALGVWLGGLIVGAAVYPLFLLAIGSPPNLGFVAAFVKLFGSGVGSAPMQVPGPVLVVIPIIVCSTAAGWALMRARHRADKAPDTVLDRATIALTFAGTWSTVCLTYYVNRAYAAGQLQTMLLPCAVCIAALLAIVMHSEEFTSLWRPASGSTLWGRAFAQIGVLPLGMLVCLCFASILLTPNPITATRNLLTPPPMSGYATYDLPQLLAAVDRAESYTLGKPGQLTYLGESFNYVFLATHVPSNAVLFPYPFTAISSVTQIECDYLEDHHSRWMVLSTDGVVAFGTSACGLYRPVSLPGLVYGQLQELK
jgi:hypothetical protein